MLTADATARERTRRRDLFHCGASSREPKQSEGTISVPTIFRTAASNAESCTLPKSMFEGGPYRERTNLRVVLMALFVAISGVGLIYYAELRHDRPTLHTVLRDLGSILVVTVAVALLWELFARRALLAELLDATRLAEEIQASGIIGVSQHWYKDIPWLPLFKSVHHLDIFFSYSDKWRNAFSEEIRAFAARGNGRVRIVLPDPESSEIVAALSRRFDRDPDQVRGHILEAKEEFERLLSRSAHPEFEWSIWYLPKEPVFSCYRFDDVAILSLYRHRKEGGVPTLILKRGGAFFEFLYAEYRAFVSGAEPLAHKASDHSQFKNSVATNHNPGA